MKNTETKPQIKRKAGKRPCPSVIRERPGPLGKLPTETGGPQGLEPTRYGDWEKNGRVSDF